MKTLVKVEWHRLEDLLYRADRGIVHEMDEIKKEHAEANKPWYKKLFYNERDLRYDLADCRILRREIKVLQGIREKTDIYIDGTTMSELTRYEHLYFDNELFKAKENKP